MGVLKEKDKNKVKEIFKDIDHDVTIWSLRETLL
jgi:hypothetical protein